jgi:Cof subfamily protein (haloacid dehalogenase superfamily)
MKYKALCVTDLDGTLLGAEHQISPANLEALQYLQAQGICTVLATGRSPYSLLKAIKPDMPFDYVIFSTGAGIYNWKGQKVIFSRHIDQAALHQVFHKLYKLNLDFMLHAPIPENHRFMYVRGIGNPDFFRRIGYYQAYAFEWDGKLKLPWIEATQLLVIADESESCLYLKLINELAPLKVVRTTSPIDHLSLWLEVFHPLVSKGSAVQYLASLFSLSAERVMAIGNDYNDVEMLDITPHAYITDNAPQELKRLYHPVSDYTQDGFAEAVQHWLKGHDSWS